MPLTRVCWGPQSEAVSEVLGAELYTTPCKLYPPRLPKPYYGGNSRIFLHTSVIQMLHECSSPDPAGWGGKSKRARWSRVHGKRILSRPVSLEQPFVAAKHPQQVEEGRLSCGYHSTQPKHRHTRPLHPKLNLREICSTTPTSHLPASVVARGRPWRRSPRPAQW